MRHSEECDEMSSGLISIGVISSKRDRRTMGEFDLQVRQFSLSICSHIYYKSITIDQKRRLIVLLLSVAIYFETICIDKCVLVD